jgi:hypothetical protein
VLKLKVFNRIFRVNELAEIDEHLTLEEWRGRSRAKLVAEVSELEGNVQFRLLTGGDNGLQVVTLFAGDGRTWSPWIEDETPFSPSSFTNLLMALPISWDDAGLEGHLLAGTALTGLFDLAGVEGLQRDVALDQLLFEQLVEARRRSSVELVKVNSLH